VQLHTAEKGPATVSATSGRCINPVAAQLAMFFIVLGLAAAAITAIVVYLRRGQAGCLSRFTTAVADGTAGVSQLKAKPLLPVCAPAKEPTAYQHDDKKYDKAPSSAGSWRSVATRWVGQSAPSSARSGAAAMARSHSSCSASSRSYSGGSARGCFSDSPTHSSSDALPTVTTDNLVPHPALPPIRTRVEENVEVSQAAATVASEG
jgi:hypothetical protein